MATTFLSLLPAPTAWPETAILTGHLAPVWLKYCNASCSLSMIIAEQPTEALSASHLTAVAPKVWLRADKLVGETLVIAFMMIMGQVLLDRIIQGFVVE